MNIEKIKFKHPRDIKEIYEHPELNSELKTLLDVAFELNDNNEEIFLVKEFSTDHLYNNNLVYCSLEQLKRLTTINGVSHLPDTDNIMDLLDGEEFLSISNKDCQNMSLNSVYDKRSESVSFGKSTCEHYTFSFFLYKAKGYKAFSWDDY